MPLLFLLACPQAPPPTPPGPTEPRGYAEPLLSLPAVQAVAADDVGGAYLVGDTFLTHLAADGTRTEHGRGTLPVGHAVTAAVAGEQLLIYVNGKGLYRGDPESGQFALAEDGFVAPSLNLINDLARPIPLRFEDGILAAAGGLYKTVDEGARWTALPIATSGHLNVLFTGLAVREEQIVAVSMLPSSLIPQDFEGLLSGTVFTSRDGGATWSAPDFPSLHGTSVALDEAGTAYIGTMDQGVLVQEGGTWRALGGPTDVVELAWHDGGLSVGSASRGIWRYEAGAWTSSSEGDTAGGQATLALTGPLGILADGTVLAYGPDATAPPEPGGATVHIALSFHVNYYHSYRGDTPTDDGFGKDIDVIRNTLDWLDRYPEVHADWDSDNAFTTDDWMVTYSPDILARIRDRVAAGRDDVRLMSWNNGAMASHTRDEFAVAIQRAKGSNEAAFGAWVPGVQPQENMFSPEHIGWYAEEGISWVTLFHSATGFTATREDVTLTEADAYGSFFLSSGDDTLETVPVYHHADVLEHGGLAGWARQIHASQSGDRLLVVHFDADSESWENFDAELAAMEGLDFVRWTTIQDYLDTHEPGGTYAFQGDTADGTGDGYQSWAEKDYNHRLFTEVMQARRTATVAAALAPGDPVVTAYLEDARAARLLALSTTNYGLAAPTLHEDRVASGTAQAADANALAAEALEYAITPLTPGSLQVVNLREAATGRVTATLEVEDPEAGVIVSDGSQTYATEVEILSETTVSAQFVAPVPAGMSLWSWEPGLAEGTLTLADAPSLPALAPPFTECAGVQSVAVLEETEGPFLSEQGTEVVVIEHWRLPTCDGTGTVTRTLTTTEGLPGVRVRVDAEVGVASVPSTLESVVLTPITCSGGAREITWRSHGGATFTRPARTPVETWNGQSADGWASVTCGETTISLAHRVPLRTSMAFLPIRNEGGQGILAPLGALWGDGPWHGGRQTGGHGIADLIVPVVGSQFRPPAPDWSGAVISYELLVGEDLDPAVLDLFAHPPWTRGE